MRATIADIRRGDRFTWAGKKYIAFDDARPMVDYGVKRHPEPEFCNVYMTADQIKPDADGIHRLGTRGLDCQTILSDKEITIEERGLIVLRPGEEPPAQDRPISEWYALSQLTHTMHSRDKARRIADDIDETRDRQIRDALRAGIGVTELMQITGLSRARIYQIRDGRR
jgi:hypothetical protein